MNTKLKLSFLALFVINSAFADNLADSYYGGDDVNYNAIYGTSSNSTPPQENTTASNQAPQETYNPNKANAIDGSMDIATPVSPVKELPVLPANVVSKINKEDKLYEQAKQQSLGFTAQQIKSYAKSLDERDKALAESSIQDLVPYNRTLNIELDSGMVKPQVIRVAYGFSTTLIFVDIDGQPWCVQNRPQSNNLFVLTSLNKCTENTDGNVFTIQPKTKFSKSNSVFLLEGEQLPITLNLIPDQKVRDETVVIKLNRQKPGSLIETKSLPETANSDLEQYLRNVPPAHAKKINVSTELKNVRAWYADGSIYLRTPYELKSQYVSYASGINMYIYKMKPIASVRVASGDKLVPIKLSGW